MLMGRRAARCLSRDARSTARKRGGSRDRKGPRLARAIFGGPRALPTRPPCAPARSQTFPRAPARPKAHCEDGRGEREGVGVAPPRPSM